MDNGNSLEQLLYDLRPVIYAALAFYSFVNKHNSSILMFSGVLFTISCLYVLNARYNNRSRFNIK